MQWTKRCKLQADAKQGPPAPIENAEAMVLPGGQSDLAAAWRMKEIDEMDMLGFLRLRAWDATREQEKKKPRHAFIDEV